MPSDAKNRFLQLCQEKCQEKGYNGVGARNACVAHTTSSVGATSAPDAYISPCILREDVIELRDQVRYEFEGRSGSKKMKDGVRTCFGFHTNTSEVLLQVLNRAVGTIDEASGRTRRNMSTTLPLDFPGSARPFKSDEDRTSPILTGSMKLVTWF